MMACFTIASWKLNRYYTRTGHIFAVPVPISRKRCPILSNTTMALNWFCFGVLVLASLGLTAAIVRNGRLQVRSAVPNCAVWQSETRSSGPLQERP